MASPTFMSRGPLRGEKLSLYEGGLRVPFIASWPARMQSGAPLRLSSEINSIDWLPTVLALAGVPRQELRMRFAGRDFSPLLLEIGFRPKPQSFEK